MNRNTCLASGAALCALFVVTSGCRKGAQGPHAMPPTSVQTALAVQTNTTVLIAAFGNAKDRASVDVVPQVSGRLVQTLIQDGATVTKGQPLFLIDASDYAARVRQIEGVVKADRANLELSRNTLARNQGLMEKKLISQETFDTLRARVSAAEGQLQMDEASLEQAQLNLTRCTLTATLDGVCSKRNVDDGNLVVAGQTRLTNIRSYDPMIVEFSVADHYLPVIRAAMTKDIVQLEVTPRGDTNRYTGTLEFFDNAVNPQTGTILLRGQVPNPKKTLWANQFVDIMIHAGTIPDAVMVPEGAVQFGKQGSYLYVASPDDKAEMRIVKTGVRFGRMIQIVEGVAANESVIVLGQMMLFPGAPVMDMSRMPPAGTPAADAATTRKK
jgi:multidrug efflux system membrane fusion protein